MGHPLDAELHTLGKNEWNLQLKSGGYNVHITRWFGNHWELRLERIFTHPSGRRDTIHVCAETMDVDRPHIDVMTRAMEMLEKEYSLERKKWDISSTTGNTPSAAR